MRHFLLALAILAVLSTFAAWAVFKPVRVLAPWWAGSVSCKHTHVCIEEVSGFPEALALYDSSLERVAEQVGPFREKPRVIFCSTETCFRSFGFNRASAATVGTSGIVISPRGWQVHYVRHEMIHHRQAEELGVLAKPAYPEWFIEGMAYALSDDPREALSEPWQRDRNRFLSWYQQAGANRLWEEALKL